MGTTNAKKIDVKGAVASLKIANRNLNDTPLVNLSIAVALTCLGVSKDSVLAESLAAHTVKSGRKTSYDRFLNQRLKDPKFERAYYRELATFPCTDPGGGGCLGPCVTCEARKRSKLV